MNDIQLKYCIRSNQETLKETPLKSTRTGCLIFHGGCLECVSQKFDQLERCKGCQYFKADWDLPDLSYTMENYIDKCCTEEEKQKRNNKIDLLLNYE